MLDTILVRRLQDGDPGGAMRRAIERFPLPEIGADVLRRYFREEGRPPGEPYRLLPMYRRAADAFRERVTMLANFVEVYLAKEGHPGVVGINLLTKVQLPNLASLYGAMLAGVDYVMMGAGIPREIPGALDALVRHDAASMKLDHAGVPPAVPEVVTFDPRAHGADAVGELRRPHFLPIVSSHTLAASLAKKSSGRVDGFIVETSGAGGHSAPPRGVTQLDAGGEPVYGERDRPDLARFRELGVPFWLAGGTGTRAGLRDALASGAAGIQVGTLFAYCDESGLADGIKRRVLHGMVRDAVVVRNDPRVSPTGLPFKIVQMEDGGFQPEDRARVCDLGYLRLAVRDEEGRFVYRCAAEPVEAYARKGGAVDETEGRRCLCNALLANIGLGQVRPGGIDEQPLLTSGTCLETIPDLLAGRESFSAADVVDYLSG
jgi:NAD(P)H-dependent flavin oxidoreductase YrpB (nitropropane dioxygenase family)